MRRGALGSGRVELVGDPGPQAREHDDLYREVLAPQGFEYGLRLMLVANCAPWGLLHFLRGRGSGGLTSKDAAMATALAAELASAARVSVFECQMSSLPSTGTGFVLLDEDLQVTSISAGRLRCSALREPDAVTCSVVDD